MVKPSLVDDAEPLFQWLYDRRICQRHALFWESWAAIFEQQKRFDKADQTFKRGIAMQAQPLWRLQRSQKSFDHRQVKLIRQQMLEGMAGAAAGGFSRKSSIRVNMFRIFRVAVVEMPDNPYRDWFCEFGSLDEPRGAEPPEDRAGHA